MGGLAAAALVLGGLAWARGPGAAGGMSVGASKDAASFGEVYRHVDKRHALCVYTRHRDEPELLRSFLDHYRAEGATRFLILDDAEADVPFRTSDPDVKVVRAAGIPNEDEHLSHYLRETAPYLDACEWVVSVDVDEFVSTRRNPCKSVAEELRDSFSEAAAVAVPWVFFSYDPTAALGPGGGDIEDVRDLTWRWNHTQHHMPSQVQKQIGDKFKDRYDRIEVKPLYRPGSLERLTLHVAELRKEDRAAYFSGVTGEPIAPSSSIWHSMKTMAGVHEPEIADALLVANHYRFSSRKNIEFKCSKRNQGKLGSKQGGYGDPNAGMLSWFASPRLSGEERTRACILAAEQSNHPEVRDTSMQEKYRNRKKGSGCGSGGNRPRPNVPALHMPSLDLLKRPSQNKLKPGRWSQEAAVSAYREQMNLMHTSCAADDQCCWVPLAPGLEALQPYDLAPFDLASWWPSEESVPQLSVTHLGVGQGTTATHAIYDAFCDQGLKTIHWRMQCNFPRGLQGEAQRFIDLQQDLHRRPPATSVEFVVQAKALLQLAADIGAEAITDSGLAADLLRVIMALAPEASVSLTYRRPDTWARNRVRDHADTAVLCAPPWFHAEEAFQWATCAARRAEPGGLAGGAETGEWGVERPPWLVLFNDVIKKPLVTEGVGSGLDGEESLALNFILYNNFVQWLIPEKNFSPICMFDRGEG